MYRAKTKTGHRSTPYSSPLPRAEPPIIKDESSLPWTLDREFPEFRDDVSVHIPDVVIIDETQGDEENLEIPESEELEFIDETPCVENDSKGGPEKVSPMRDSPVHLSPLLHFPHSSPFTESHIVGESVRSSAMYQELVMAQRAAERLLNVNFTTGDPSTIETFCGNVENITSRSPFAIDWNHLHTSGVTPNLVNTSRERPPTPIPDEFRFDIINRLFEATSQEAERESIRRAREEYERSRETREQEETRALVMERARKRRIRDVVENMTTDQRRYNELRERVERLQRERTLAPGWRERAREEFTIRHPSYRWNSIRVPNHPSDHWTIFNPRTYPPNSADTPASASAPARARAHTIRPTPGHRRPTRSVRKEGVHVRATPSPSMKKNKKPTKESSSPNSGIGDDMTCVVCLDAKKNRLLIPCGHVCMCAECCDTLIARASVPYTPCAKCPLCRTDIDGVSEAFI